MKLELIIPFLCSIFMTVKCEVQGNIFLALESVWASTTQILTTEEGVIVDVDDESWIHEFIEKVSIYGFIAIIVGIVLFCLCCCVGLVCFCRRRARSRGHGSIYEYYQGMINKQ